MPSAFNSSLDLQKYQPYLLSKQWEGTISWGVRCRTGHRIVALAVFPLCWLGAHTSRDGIILLGLERMEHIVHSNALEGIGPGEGNFLLFCNGAFCRQSFMGLALTSQGLPWVAEGSGMVVSGAEAGLFQRQ